VISPSPSGQRAEGKGFEPSFPEGKPPEQSGPATTVSGYLPFPLSQDGPTGSRTRTSAAPGRCLSVRPWARTPVRANKWTGRGVEPRSPGCRPGVVPLDQPPIRPSLQKVRPRIELGPPRYQGGMPPAHSRTREAGFAVVPEGVEPPFPLCKRGVVGRWTTGRKEPVARVGVEPTDTRLSIWPLCLFAYRAVVDASTRQQLRARGSNHGRRAYETRPSASPPALSQAPESSRASRPYESRPDTCHAWVASISLEIAEGRVELPRLKGRELLRPVRLPFRHSASNLISSPDGSRTRFSTLRGWCPCR
jgi:hypothetical protein